MGTCLHATPGEVHWRETPWLAVLHPYQVHSSLHPKGIAVSPLSCPGPLSSNCTKVVMALGHDCRAKVCSPVKAQAYSGGNGSLSTFFLVLSPAVGS